MVVEVTRLELLLSRPIPSGGAFFPATAGRADDDRTGLDART